MLELRTGSLAETHAVAAALARLSRAGDLIVLSGEMGAGKTAFAAGFGRALGITEPITSPTYTLVHTYDITAAPHTARARRVHHADLYRLDHLAEIADLALEELVEDGIVLVEWGEVLETMFPSHLLVRIDVDESDPDGGQDGVAPEGRVIGISASGPQWATRWDAVRAACEASAC